MVNAIIVNPGNKRFSLFKIINSSFLIFILITFKESLPRKEEMTRAHAKRRTATCLTITEPPASVDHHIRMMA